jgi:hypothetical protein
MAQVETKFDRLLAEVNQLKLERDDFEQRLHAHQRGEL